MRYRDASLMFKPRELAKILERSAFSRLTKHQSSPNRRLNCHALISIRHLINAATTLGLGFIAFIAAISLSYSYANALTEKPQQIRNIFDIVSIRNYFLNAVWGAGGWPVKNQATLVTSYDPRVPSQAAQLFKRGIPTTGPISGTFSRAEELSVAVSIGGHVHKTLAYHLLPSVAPRNRLVIVHGGHGDNLDGAGFNETLAQFLKAGYSVLAMYMPNYGPAPRTPPNVPENGDRHTPIFSELNNSTSTFRVFLEPVAACLNYLRKSRNYADVSMTGLSGGGWTTAIYSAIDPNIHISAAIEGSLPIDLRFGGSVGDAEQMLPSIYHDIVGYRDLYTLAGYGYRRKHIQIAYQYDTCCFSDFQWDPFHPNDIGGLGRELNKYAADIQARLKNGLSGGFQVARYNDNGGAHTISVAALNRGYQEISINPPETSAIFFYNTRGQGARSVLRANGSYEYVGPTTGFATDWTNITATKNEHLFFYKRNNGRAAISRFLDNGSYSYIGAATGVGSGWTHVTSVGSQYLFFYNKNSGTAKIGQINGAGSYSDIGPVLHGFSTRWTHLAGLRNDALFFLDGAP